MFQVGDTVSYGTAGACKIMSREDKMIGDTTIACFVLKPVFDKSLTISVPLANRQLMGRMHKVMSRDEAIELINGMPQEDASYVANQEDRRQLYTDTIKSGDHHALVRMIKSIHNYKQERLAMGKHLSTLDESAMHEAETMLYTEFALALDLRPDEVPPFIRAHIPTVARQ
jgi:CarD family transcriptional regulator